jgi:hypothetical protein
MNIIIIILIIVIIVLYIFHINKPNESFTEDDTIDDVEEDVIKRITIKKRDPVEDPEIPREEMGIYNALLYSGFKYSQNIFLKTPYTFNNLENVYYNFNTFIEIYFPQLLFDKKFQQFALLYNFINSKYLTEVTEQMKNAYDSKEFNYKFVNRIIMFNENNIYENRAIYERMFGRLNLNNNLYQSNYNNVIIYYMKRLRNINEITINEGEKTITIDFSNDNAKGDKSYAFKFTELPEYEYTVRFINIKASKFNSMYKFILLRLRDMDGRIEETQMTRINKRVERKPKYYNSDKKQGSNSYKNIHLREIKEYYDNKTIEINEKYDKLIEDYNKTENPTNEIISNIEVSREKELAHNEKNRRIENDSVLGTRKDNREATKEKTNAMREIQKAINDEINQNTKAVEDYIKDKIDFDNLKLSDYDIYNFDLLDIIKFNVMDNMKEELINDFIINNAPVLSKHVNYDRKGDVTGMDLSDRIIIQQITNPYKKIIKGFDYAVEGYNFINEEDIQFELRNIFINKLYENLSNMIELYNTIFNPKKKILKLNRIGMIILERLIQKYSGNYDDVNEIYWDFKQDSFQLYVSEHINSEEHANISSIFDNYPVYLLEEENFLLDLMIENSTNTFNLNLIINKEQSTNLQLMTDYNNGKIDDNKKNFIDIVNDTYNMLNKELYNSILTIYNNNTSIIHIIGVISYINNLLEYDSISNIINKTIDKMIEEQPIETSTSTGEEIKTDDMILAEKCKLEYGNCIDVIGVYGIRKKNKAINCMNKEFKKENNELYKQRRKYRSQITGEAFIYISIAIATAVLTVITGGAAAGAMGGALAGVIAGSSTIIATATSSTLAAVLSSAIVIGGITSLSIKAEDINAQQLFDMKHNYLSTIISCEALLEPGDIIYIYNICRKLYDNNNENDFKNQLKHELKKILYNYTKIKSSLLFTILKLEIEQGVKSSEYNMNIYERRRNRTKRGDIKDKIKYFNEVVTIVNSQIPTQTISDVTQTSNPEDCKELDESARAKDKLKQINCKIKKLKEKHETELITPFKQCREGLLKVCDTECNKAEVYNKYPGKRNYKKKRNCRISCQNNMGQASNEQLDFCNEEEYNKKINGEGYKYKGHNSNMRFKNCVTQHRLENGIGISANSLCEYYCDNDIYRDKYMGATAGARKTKCKDECLLYNSRRPSGTNYTDFIKTRMTDIADCNRTCEKETYYDRFTGVIRDRKVKCFNKCKSIGKNNFVNEINACKTNCETNITYDGKTQQMYKFFRGVLNSTKLNNCRQQCAISGSRNMTGNFTSCANDCSKDSIYKYFRGITGERKRKNCRNECIAAIPIYKSLIATQTKCTNYCNSNNGRFYGTTADNKNRCLKKCYSVDGNTYTLNNGILHCYNKYIKGRTIPKKVLYADCMDNYYNNKNNQFETLQQYFPLIDFNLDNNGKPLNIIFPSGIGQATQDKINSIWNEYKHILY